MRASGQELLVCEFVLPIVPFCFHYPYVPAGRSFVGMGYGYSLQEGEGENREQREIRHGKGIKGDLVREGNSIRTA